MIKRFSVTKKFVGGTLNGLSYTFEIYHDVDGDVPMFEVGQTVKPWMGSPFIVTDVHEVHA